MILTILVAAHLMQPKVGGIELGTVPVTEVVNPQRTSSPQQAVQVHGPYTLSNELKWSDVIKDINNGSLRWDK